MGRDRGNDNRSDKNRKEIFRDFFTNRRCKKTRWIGAECFKTLFATNQVSLWKRRHNSAAWFENLKWLAPSDKWELAAMSFDVIVAWWSFLVTRMHQILTSKCSLLKEWAIVAIQKIIALAPDPITLQERANVLQQAKAKMRQYLRIFRG